MARLRAEQRAATDQEKTVLAGWRSWGALPGVFESDAPAARQVKDLLSDAQWRAARRTTINAHYTDPQLAQGVWAGVIGLGFTGGRVLEPGCGSGIFLAAVPPGVVIDAVGVELDPVSAQIAVQLHPQATIRAESFTDTPYSDDTFDLTIGNVPFADVRLHDPRHNAGRHSLHNYFLIKSLALTRPGGLVATLTSRYTMDAHNTAARAELYRCADLVAAIRLPTGAHRAFAGTDAVTDLLILRKRLPGQAPGEDTWLQAPPAGDDLEGVSLNQWWTIHPGAVLGAMRLGHGMHGSRTLVVDPHVPLEQIPHAFTTAIRAETAAAAHRYTPRHHPPDTPQAATPPVASPLVGESPVGRSAAVLDGHYRRGPGGTWTQMRSGQEVPVDIPTSQAREFSHLVDLRDHVLDVLSREGADSDDTPALTQARSRLRASYEAYVHRYGPINRVTITATSRRDSFGDAIITRRYPPAVRTFRTDPHSATVRALERFDEDTGTATGATILTGRVLSPHRVRVRAEHPADAIAISLDTTGRVDLDHVATLLDLPSREQARQALGTLVFDEPGTGRLVPAAEYLSGNVRAALAAARQAARTDPAFHTNVDALTRVLPTDLTPGEITATLGAVWIPAEDVQAFLRETLRDAYVSVEHLGGSNWKVRGGQRWTPAATSTWGTDRIPAHDIAERLMRQRRIVIHDTITTADGREITVVNPVATETAQDKAAALQERFATWIWSDTQRALALVKVYNETFNAIVLRSYHSEGERLRLPGLAKDFTPHPHQRAAVARMIGEPAVGLFHAVGAGKTAEMVMGVTELKRLGLVTKPAVIVPNHMLEQFTREWLQLYPGANILPAASQDLRAGARRMFIARAATGDWDGIILTHSAFGSIPVSPEGEHAYLDAQLDTRRAQLERARAAGIPGNSIKQIEKQVLREEQRLQKLLDHKVDPGLTWEQSGIDYLCIDEMHLFKNLTITSNIQDVARDGSKRATDLDMKIAIMRAAAGPNGRVITGATATPIANTMAEAYVMQHYLRPDLLTDAGLTDFDAWAATFGRTITTIEMRPAGDGFRAKDRFASFQNLPEMLTMWHVPADVKTAQDLALPIPAIARDEHGRRTPQVIAVPMTGAGRQFMTTLKDRAEKIRARAVTPDVDNMLRISSDGRKAGLDPRLTGPTTPPTGPGEVTKIDIAAAHIHHIWAEHRHDTYPDAHQPGALQVVFCDLGTPSATWNVYDALREALTQQGMDPTRIRFIHDAKDDQAKARLFAACRAGGVDVIIGSTAKMGVGTNIQDRAIALHHLDCPWRPADVEQREGRILRQGNHNPEIRILRYVTEGSFDGYMWQGVARKAAFIDQVMHGQLDHRSADDIDPDGEQFDYATVTAIATGNPLLLQRAQAQADLDKLRRLETGHTRAQTHLARTIPALTAQIEALTALQPLLEDAITTRTPTSGDAFTTTINGARYHTRVEAHTALHDYLAHKARNHWSRADPVTVGLGGHTITVHLQHRDTHTLINAALVGLEDRIITSTPWTGNTSGHGLITRLENMLTSLDTALTDTTTRLADLRTDLAEAHHRYGTPFPHAAELTAATTRLQSLDEQLHTQATSPPDPSPTPDDHRIETAAAIAATTPRHRPPETPHRMRTEPTRQFLHP